MKTYRDLRFGVRRAAVMAALLACAGLAAVEAQTCEPSTSGFVFLHPFFAGKPWMYAASTTAIAIPDGACNPKPDAFSISADAGSNVAVLVSGGSVRIAQVNHGCSGGRCPSCFVEMLDPAALSTASIPIAATTPVHVLRQTGFTFDQVKFVVAGTSGRLFAITANGDASAITRVDTLRLAARSFAQSVRALSGALNASTGQDTALWVAGTRGLLRLFAFNGATWGTGRSFDIDSTDTVLCVGDGYAGTSSGRIYRRSGSTFVLDARPVTTALRTISAQGAAGDAGKFVLHEGSMWTQYSTGAGQVRTFGLIKTGSGSTVELLDSAWGYHSYAYRDSATRIASVTPASVQTAFSSRVPYSYNGSSTTVVTLNLADPDSNFEVPAVAIGTPVSGYTSFDNNGTYTLRMAQPGLDCASGVLQLADVAPTLTLRPDSVIFEADALLGTINVGCGGVCEWRPYAFRVARRWIGSSSLEVTVGDDLLRISLGAPTVSMSSPRAFGSPGSPRISATRDAVLIAGIDAHTVKRLTLHDAGGRIVAHVPVRQGTVTVSLHSLPAGILYVRIGLATGRSIVRPIPLVK